MKENVKQLLLKDLCARLPYGVKTTYSINNYLMTIRNIDVPSGVVDIVGENHRFIAVPIEEIKPYLRPLSSMTEEEKKIMRSYGFELIPYDTGHTGFANIESCIDEVSFKFMEGFLNACHFDYRGLIPMGLALEAPKDMYNIK